MSLVGTIDALESWNATGPCAYFFDPSIRENAEALSLEAGLRRLLVAIQSAFHGHLHQIIGIVVIARDRSGEASQAR